MKSTPKSDYMKHWKIVRNFAKARYDFSVPDLDMMFFLYSEEYFTKDKYREFEKLLRWESNRFDKLLKNGWIENYKKKKHIYANLLQVFFQTYPSCIMERYEDVNHFNIRVAVIISMSATTKLLSL